MSKTIKLNKGLDINLLGVADEKLVDSEVCNLYSIKPTDFPGLIPKIAVKPGFDVKAGSVLFFDKYNPDIKFTSPVSGKVKEVERGERRKVLRIVIEADKDFKYDDFGKKDLNTLNAEDIKKTLLDSGTWTFFRKRPYAVIANPNEKPKSIFISGFDNAPLAPNYDFIIKDNVKEFQVGIDIISKLTEGKINLNISDKTGSVYSNITGVEKNTFVGKHPSSTVGTQINHIDPINKGEVIWYLNPQDVIIIGRLFTEGKYDARKIIALTGSEVNEPKYYNTITGASVNSITLNNVKEGNNRYISGNVLTGSQISANDYIGFYDSQITIIPEGDYYEFFGWIMPRFKKFSMSRTYFSWLMPNKKYALDTNINGGERALVMSGQYEKVVPMDIYPVELIKACLAEDIDKMEQLGIYEVAEEDFALCDYVCTSKTETQAIIREGINLMIKELS